MTDVQAMTGQGGWPLNCFLTPELKPFYGGTYFPPENMRGRASFMQVLRQIAGLWDTRREHILETASDFHQKLEAYTAREPGDSALSADLLARATVLFKREYDPHFGGFGAAPKFPRPSQPAFLLRYGRRAGDTEAVQMVLHTCDRMAAGGMYDQLGGGFARYSVDEQWLVPHFEKMLYDNAQLVEAYSQAYRLTKKPLYRRIVAAAGQVCRAPAARS